MFRRSNPAYSALSGDGARRFGGRWNPPRTFPVVYCALEPETADAEAARSRARAAMRGDPSNRTDLREIDVSLTRVLDLTRKAHRDQLGITLDELAAEDPAVARSIGDAAHHLGFEGVLAPSATGAGTVLAVFVDILSAASSIEVVDNA